MLLPCRTMKDGRQGAGVVRAFPRRRPEPCGLRLSGSGPWDPAGPRARPPTVRAQHGRMAHAGPAAVPEIREPCPFKQRRRNVTGRGQRLQLCPCESSCGWVTPRSSSGCSPVPWGCHGAAVAPSAGGSFPRVLPSPPACFSLAPGSMAGQDPHGQKVRQTASLLLGALCTGRYYVSFAGESQPHGGAQSPPGYSPSVGRSAPARSPSCPTPLSPRPAAVACSAPRLGTGPPFSSGLLGSTSQQLHLARGCRRPGRGRESTAGPLW